MNRRYLLPTTLLCALSAAVPARGGDDDTSATAATAAPTTAVETETPIDARQQDAWLEDALETEARYRIHIAQLQRLRELTIEHADRVRLDQIQTLRSELISRHQTQRRQHRDRLAGEWREQLDAQLELRVRVQLPAAQSTSTRRAAPRDDRSVFERRREEARQRLAARREDASASPAIPTPTRRSASRISRAAPDPADSTAIEPRLITQREAYARAASEIRDGNASRTFWTLRDELTQEQDAFEQAQSTARAMATAGAANDSHDQDPGK